MPAKCDFMCTAEREVLETLKVLLADFKFPIIGKQPNRGQVVNYLSDKSIRPQDPGTFAFCFLCPQKTYTWD